MTPPQHPPQEIVEWLSQRHELLGKALARAGKANANQDAKAWLLGVLEQMAAIETIGRRAVHLLGIYAARTEVAKPAEVAKASEVTISTVQSRAGSKLAQELWREVYGSKDASGGGS